MNSQTKESKRLPDVTSTTRCLWVTLEASEVIELKRIAIDRDLDAAVEFFYDILTPRVHNAAKQRNIAVEILAEETKNGRISG